MRISLQTRLIIVYISLATIPLIVAGFIFAWESFVAQQQQALTNQQQSARQVDTLMTAFVSRLENSIRVILDVQNLDELTVEEQNMALKRLLDLDDSFESLTILNKDGVEVSKAVAGSRGFQPILMSRTLEDEFLVPKVSRSTFYDIYPNQMTGEAQLLIAEPFFDTVRNAFAGVLVAKIRFRGLWDLLVDVEVERGQDIFITEDDGNIIAHKNPLIVLDNRKFDIPDDNGNQLQWADDFKGRTLGFIRNLVGPGIHVGFSKDLVAADRPIVILAVEEINLADQRILVLVQQPIHEALAIASNAVTTTILVMLIAVFIAGVAGLYVIRQIFKPIATMVVAAQTISEGDLLHGVEIKRKDELGTLARAFNDMAGRLRNSITNLEERVRERTKALETGAAISQQIAAILDVDELLDYVVKRIQSEFDFYRVQIYLLNQDGTTLSLAQSSAETAQPLPEADYDLRSNQADNALQNPIVQVARSGQLLLQNNLNLTADDAYQSRYPESRSVLIIPLRKAEETLGLLDIHSRQADYFTDDDVSLMQSLADQLTLAIANARQFTKTQTALEEVERLNRRLTREAWQKSTEETENGVTGYRFEQGSVSPLFAKNEVTQSLTESSVEPVETDDDQLSPRNACKDDQQSHEAETAHQDKEATLAIPLLIRGQVIGSLGLKRENAPDWQQEEIAAIKSVANQVSLALENARLSTEQEKTIVKLQDLDRLKSEFLTSMSHELRTPLNAILGFADVLLSGIDGELNEMALYDIQLIYNSGQHLLTLINDILDISKIEAGLMEIVPEPLPLKPVIDDVVAASASLLKKTIKLLVDLPEDMPPVLADNIRLKQILFNLISNASKFTHEGSITVQIKRHPAQSNLAQISIIDTGIGIPADKQETIFERFKQADMTTTKEYGGTGLGLAITKQLVEMHGGEIELKSQVGVGSEFCFTIPLAEITPT